MGSTTLISVISLLSVVTAIVLGARFKVNTGLVAIAIASVLALTTDISAEQVVSGWPTSLFVTLLGMMLLFTIAASNGTLSVIARKAAAGTRGSRRLLPVLFFLLSALLAGFGPGNIAACALLLPIALTVASEEEIRPLLMSTMVITGSNVGGLSPIAPTGIIAGNLAADVGLHVAGRVFVDMAVSGTLFAAVCYLVLGGLRLHPSTKTLNGLVRLSGRQKTTVIVILCVVAGILVFGLPIGLTAFSGAVLLLLLNAGQEHETMRSLPWPALILVSGMAVLVHVMDLLGGVTLITNILQAILTPLSLGPVFVLLGGAMSSVSSAAGVVLPTLIPIVPGVVESLSAGMNSAQVISAVVIGSHVVTTSPVSTLGALAVASSDSEARDRLFMGLFAVAGFGLIFGAVYVLLVTLF